MARFRKFANRQSVISGVLVLASVMATPSFGQNAPSQADFANALRPIPAVLQLGHSGLPTFAPAHPVQSSHYLSASAHIGIAAEQPPAATPGVAARAAQVRPVGCPAQPAEAGPMIGFKVAFEFGSARLERQSLDTLRNLGNALNRQLADQKRFEIQGHTDAVGSFAYNEQLSAARAAAVKQFLVTQMGVSAGRLVTTGAAFCQPADPHHPYAAANRRVVVLNQAG